MSYDMAMKNSDMTFAIVDEKQIYSKSGTIFSSALIDEHSSREEDGEYHERGQACLYFSSYTEKYKNNGHIKATIIKNNKSN